MQKFYIHQNDQQQGPFSKDELKGLDISSETMVWFEGAENWTKAIEIENLKDIFKSIPPPIHKNPPINPPPLVNNKPKDSTKPTFENKPQKRNTTLIIIALTAILVGGFGAFVFTNQQEKQEEIERQLE